MTDTVKCATDAHRWIDAAEIGHPELMVCTVCGREAAWVTEHPYEPPPYSRRGYDEMFAKRQNPFTQYIEMGGPAEGQGGTGYVNQHYGRLTDSEAQDLYRRGDLSRLDLLDRGVSIPSDDTSNWTLVSWGLCIALAAVILVLVASGAPYW